MQINFNKIDSDSAVDYEQRILYCRRHLAERAESLEDSGWFWWVQMLIKNEARLEEIQQKTS